MKTAQADGNLIVLRSILKHNQAAILTDWLEGMSTALRRDDLMKHSELQGQCTNFLRLLGDAIEAAGVNFQASAWDAVREMLADMSRSRAVQGFTSSESALFVLSAKRPIFTQVRNACKDDCEQLASETWAITHLFDNMALHTTEIYQRTRELIIKRQQEELLELSTPVVKLWEGILALPIIGTLDSARTQVVMESLLDAIMQTDSKVAIIDITGVPTVDTVVAQHLMKTVTAARLMGADCIISGVRPQIAQTIVHLGIDLQTIATKPSLSSAFKLALVRAGIVAKV